MATICDDFAKKVQLQLLLNTDYYDQTAYDAASCNQLDPQNDELERVKILDECDDLFDKMTDSNDNAKSTISKADFSESRLIKKTIYNDYSRGAIPKSDLSENKPFIDDKRIGTIERVNLPPVKEKDVNLELIQLRTQMKKFEERLSQIETDQSNKNPEKTNKETSPVAILSAEAQTIRDTELKETTKLPLDISRETVEKMVEKLQKLVEMNQNWQKHNEKQNTKMRLLESENKTLKEEKLKHGNIHTQNISCLKDAIFAHEQQAGFLQQELEDKSRTIEKLRKELTAKNEKENKLKRELQESRQLNRSFREKLITFQAALGNLDVPDGSQ